MNLKAGLPPVPFVLLTLIVLTSASLVKAQSQSQYDKGTPPQHAVGVSSFVAIRPLIWEQSTWPTAH
jgi:hypothetical protein